MTKRRKDEGGTEFGLWLRKQPEIDSSKGFVASDVDYIWKNYKTGEWMIIEEKRYSRDISFCQRDLLTTFHKSAKSDVNYKGIHLLVFERTNPDDGRIWLDRKEISKSDLIYFLRHFKRCEELQLQTTQIVSNKPKAVEVIKHESKPLPEMGWIDAFI